MRVLVFETHCCHFSQNILIILEKNILDIVLFLTCFKDAVNIYANDTMIEGQLSQCFMEGTLRS